MWASPRNGNRLPPKRRDVRGLQAPPSHRARGPLDDALRAGGARVKPSEALTFKRPLRAHQAQALDRFAYSPEAALLWEMGTGKTTAAIAWLRSKYNVAREVTPTLVISPVATLYNWLEEFKINAPEKVADSVLVPYMRTKRQKFTGTERAYVIRTNPKPIVVLNGDSLDNDEVIAALRGRKFKNFIGDEIHKFKNHKSKRLEKLLSITDSIPNRMILTGTPILNNYLDLWAPYRILDCGSTFGMNFFVFRERFFEDKNVRWKGEPKYFPDWRPKPDCEEAVASLMAAKSSRLRKTDCLDLPPLEEVKHAVELGSEQAKAYVQMEEELLAEVQGGVCAASNALSKVNRLLQILSGHLPVEFDYQGEKVLTYFKDNPRLAALKELLEELSSQHKVIVWSSYKANYIQLRDVFRQLGIEWAELVGGTKDRQGEIDRFQKDPKCRVMLSNPQAGGVGVNLTAASYAIYYSRTYSLGDRLQSEARNHRGGSEIHEKITLIDLVAKNTLDEDVLAALLRKENFSDNVLDRLKQPR